MYLYYIVNTCSIRCDIGQRRLLYYCFIMSSFVCAMCVRASEYIYRSVWEGERGTEREQMLASIAANTDVSYSLVFCHTNPRECPVSNVVISARIFTNKHTRTPRYYWIENKLLELQCIEIVMSLHLFRILFAALRIYSKKKTCEELKSTAYVDTRYECDECSSRIITRCTHTHALCLRTRIVELVVFVGLIAMLWVCVPSS